MMNEYTYPRYEHRLKRKTNEHIKVENINYTPPKSKLEFCDYGDRVKISRKILKDIQQILRVILQMKPFEMYPKAFLVDCIYYHIKYENFDNDEWELGSITSMGKFVCLENRYEIWKLLRISYNDGLVFVPTQFRNIKGYDIASIFETHLIVFLNSGACNNIVSFKELLKRLGHSSIKDILSIDENDMFSVLHKMIDIFQNEKMES